MKWHTPEEPCAISIDVSVSGPGWAQSTVDCNITNLAGKDPPNPLADDRNDNFTPAPAPVNEEVTSASWGPWWQEHWVWVPDWDQCWHSDWVDTSYTDADGNEVSDGYWDDWYHWVDNGWWEDPWGSPAALLFERWSYFKEKSKNCSPSSSSHCCWWAVFHHCACSGNRRCSRRYRGNMDRRIQPNQNRGQQWCLSLH